MIKAYTLKNKNNYEVTILNLGGIIHEIKMPDRNGKVENIIHGLDDIEKYKDNAAYLGAIIGRVGGRIDSGKFELNGQSYQVPVKDRGNALHGGLKGLDRKFWTVEEEGQSLILRCVSKDGDEGFPGNLQVKVIYTLTDDNELVLEYEGLCDEDTLLNLTNHSYFNLNPTGDILEQELYVNSDYLIELREDSIPTGALIPVEKTPFDFNTAKAIGLELNGDHDQIRVGNGYDHPWVLNKGEKQLELRDEKTGRVLTATSDQNAVVLYSHNFPVNEAPHLGLAIEFQNDPDSIHHDHFNSCILEKGQTYKQKTVYKFSVE